MSFTFQMLSNIFLYLDKKNRIACKEVCKQWLMVLMTDTYFREDRHLFLNHCVLEEGSPPWSIFENSPYGYNMLTLGSDVTLANDDCWSIFGDKITFLDIARNSFISTNRYIKLLTLMPYIRILRVHNDRAIHAGLFGRAMDLLAVQGTTLNLEELRVACVNCNPMKNEYFDIFPRLLKIAPHLKKIHIETMSERMIPELQKIVKACPKVYITVNLMFQFQYWASIVELDLTGINVEQVEISYDSGLEYLQELINKNDSIKSVVFNGHGNGFPTDEIRPRVSKLKAEAWTQKRIGELELFVNLTDLSICGLTHCLQLHEPLRHLGVWKLFISTRYRLDCPECFKAILISFPNVVELTLDMDIMSAESFSMILEILKSKKNLKKLSIKQTYYGNPSLQDIFHQLPANFTLEIDELSYEISAVSYIHINFNESKILNIFFFIHRLLQK